MRNQVANDTDQPALQRDPDDWKTGDEPMTDAQRSYLEDIILETVHRGRSAELSLLHQLVRS